MSKEYAVIGTKVAQQNAVNKVTGKAIYTGDVVLPGMLHGKILRSPYAHARIRYIDTSVAERLPGVKAVISADNVPRSLLFGIDGRDEPFMAWDRHVRFAGQEVAAVAAVDIDTAAELAA